MRRNGEYTSKGKRVGKGMTVCDLNGLLLKHALKTLRSHWTKLFHTTDKQSVAKLADDFVNQWYEAVGDINSWLGDDVEKVKMVSTEFAKLCTSTALVVVFGLCVESGQTA